MAGKGDKRRPMQINREEFDKNWNEVFQKNIIDKILTKEVDKTVPEDEVALLLSGGVDSISVGFAAHRLNKKIHAYSFRLHKIPSYDYNKAKDVAQMMGWKFTGITIDIRNLEEDFFELVEMGCRKKTQFECTYPFLHMYPKINEKYVLSGWAADGYYGLSKKAMIHYKGDNFNEFRNDYYKEENRAGYIWHKKVADDNQKILVTPYLSKSVKNFFYKHNHEELNKPFQKHHIRNSFYEFNEIGRVENHLNLQIESGVTKLFGTLLYNKKINFKNRGRMLDVYRDWYELNRTSTLDNFL